MPIDSSIPLSAMAPKLDNPLDVAVKGLTLKGLSQQSTLQDRAISDDQAVRDAFKNNTSIDPVTGQVTVNRQGILSQLPPQKAVDYQKLFQSQDLEKMKYDTETMGNLLGRAYDENSYQGARAKAVQMGLSGADKLPPQYDANTVQNILLHQQEGMKQLDYFQKQQGLDIEKTKASNEQKRLQVELFKTYGASGAGGGQGAAIPGGKTNGAVDPAVLIPKNVPPDRQAKAFDETSAAQNTAKNAPAILDSFDKSANNQHAMDYVPGTLNADQKSLHALLGPTFKDVEGTVRQAAMDNMFANITPQFGDDKNTIATKRAALISYLQSKSSAPTTKGFGIDLAKYPSTTIDPKVLMGGVPTQDDINAELQRRGLSK